MDGGSITPAAQNQMRTYGQGDWRTAVPQYTPNPYKPQSFDAPSLPAIAQMYAQRMQAAAPQVQGQQFASLFGNNQSHGGPSGYSNQSNGGGYFGPYIADKGQAAKGIAQLGLGLLTGNLLAGGAGAGNLFGAIGNRTPEGLDAAEQSFSGSYSPTYSTTSTSGGEGE